MEMLKTLEQIVVRAMGKEPSAWLYEIQSVMKVTDEGQMHPEDVYEMTVVFGMPDNRTLTYHVDKAREIAENIVNEPWLQDCPLPHKILNGLEAAYDRLKQANLAYSSVYPNVVLRHPLHPGVIEPSYFFKIATGKGDEFVAVGLFSANVQITQ